MIIQEAILQLNPSIVKLIDRVGYDANNNVVEYDMDAAQALMDSKAYQDKRASKYPSIQEQLDMQYWDSVNGTTTWKDAIATVKTENPKP
jgi:ABC-type enterochelin transport system substrate-binding protein